MISYNFKVIITIDIYKINLNAFLDDYGRIKISLSNIWNKTYLNELKSNCNIICELVESDKDGDVYLIDV